MQSKEGMEWGWVNMENTPLQGTLGHTLIFPMSPHASIPLCLLTSSLPFSKGQPLHLHCPHLPPLTLLHQLLGLSPAFLTLFSPFDSTYKQINSHTVEKAFF